MKRLAIIAPLALLAACEAREEAPAPEAAATDTMPVDAAATPAAGGGTPGTYDVTLADGTKRVATLNADGTYQRTEGEKVVDKGTWVARGNQTCFDPEGDAPETCNTRGPAAADGSFESTNPEGAVAKVVPRS